MAGKKLKPTIELINELEAVVIINMIKVIGTIGPSSVDVDVLIKLKSIGLSSFRINLSHSSDELLEHYYKQFGLANIMPSLDTQGAQFSF